MTLAQIDTLELELRKLDGVRTVGFTTSQEALYIQLFIDSTSTTASLPFEATRIAKRHSNQSIAVELVRATFANSSTSAPAQISYNKNTDFTKEDSEEALPSYSAGSIAVGKQNDATPKTKTATHADFFRPTGYVEDDKEILEVPSNSFNEDSETEEDIEIDLNKEETENNLIEQASNNLDDSPRNDRIELLLVSTSPENDEIEIHLSLYETRTIGRAPSNRGLLGAIDSTVNAITELTGVDEFHGEWARSLEPGAEHASLVAVGLINDEGNETRHGIAGGSSPIEAAARATLNALNRIATLSNS